MQNVFQAFTPLRAVIPLFFTPCTSDVLDNSESQSSAKILKCTVVSGRKEAECGELVDSCVAWCENYHFILNRNKRKK